MKRQVQLELLERRVLLTADLVQVGYFDLWDGEIIRSTDAAGIAYHPPSGHLYLTDSEINELPEFEGNNIFEISLAGDQVFREIASNNDEPTGIAYSEYDGFFYVTNDDWRMRGITRYDLQLNTPLARRNTSEDVSTATDPEGITVDPATGTLYVVDGALGGMQVLAYDAELNYQYHFPVATKMQDAEGIAYDTQSGDLFVVSGDEDAIFRYTVTGELVQEWSLDHLEPDPVSPQGLTFAPTSDPTDDPGRMALYIADGMKDDVPDGRVYEVVFTSPPIVDAGPDQKVVLPDSALLSGSASDDGTPGPLTTSWSQVSGPGSVTFDDPDSLHTTASFTVTGTYVLQLSASDTETTVTDQMTVTVTDQDQDDGDDVTIQTVEVRIHQSSDDAEERPSGNVKLNSGDLELVEDTSTQIVGLRFPGLDVPAGASILKAYIQFQTDEVSSEATSLWIHGQATDDADSFQAETADISSRPRTSAAVAWEPAAWDIVGQAEAAQRTPDLTPIVQEVVGRVGWSRNNALAFFFSGAGRRVAEAFEGNSAAAPLLRIEFTEDGSPLNQPPIVDAGPDQTVILPDSALLDGTVSDDGLPDATVTQHWTQLSGPAAAVIGDPTAIDTPVSFSAAGTYHFRLTADDSELTSSDEMVVTVLEETLNGTSIEVQITESSDDAEERPSGNVNLTSGDLELVDDTSNQIVGLRFASVGVPRGATITAAYLQFQVDEPSSDPAHLVIQGQASDLPASFAKVRYDISSRPRTTATVDWEPPAWTSVGEAGAEQRSPNLAAILQELVDRPGWNVDQPMAFVITGSGRRVAEAADGSGGPRLYIEYVGGPNQAPSVDAGPDQTIILPDLALLDGTVTDDGLPNSTLTTQWMQVAGPAEASITTPESWDTTVSFQLPGTYTFRLTADDTEATGSDEVTVTVLDSDTTIHTMQVRIEQSSDDAEERPSGNVKLSSGDLELVDDTSNQTVGLRFHRVEIPAGAVIVNAHVQFQADELSSGAADLMLRGEASDNPDSFTTSEGDLSTRPRTSASIPWAPADWDTVGQAADDQRTPDLSPVIQELVDRSGWKEGNALVLFVTGSGRRTAESYDGLPAAAPLLHVEYAIPQSTALAADVVTLYPVAADVRTVLPEQLTPSDEPTEQTEVASSQTVAQGDRVTLREVPVGKTPFEPRIERLNDLRRARRRYATVDQALIELAAESPEPRVLDALARLRAFLA